MCMCVYVYVCERVSEEKKRGHKNSMDGIDLWM